MNDDKPDKKDLARFHSLQEKRRQLMTLAPKKAMERILEDPQPLALVHSFPEQDFYFLIHDIGPEDALPLLSLASNRQWDHFVDLDTWQKDQIDIRAATRWLDLLLEADPKRFIDWFLHDRLEFVEFYLFENIEVRVREHDQDPSEFGEDFFSLDNIHFIRYVDRPTDAGENKITEEQRKKFIVKLAENLANFDFRIFQGVLLEAAHVIPAEIEEECYRMRNVRLAEKGFLPFDEAVGIYQPVKVQDLAKQSAKNLPPAADPSHMFPVPLYPIRMLSGDNHFTRALANIESEHVLPHLQAEFANLCNRIIVADHKTIQERDQLRDIVKKACGYLSIGLERLSGAGEKIDPSQTAALITRHPLPQIFRVGFGEALKLKWRTEKWLDRSWFARSGMRLTFWGEQWLGVLGGLLIKKPLFYDNYKSGVLYREFASLEDIRTTEDIANQIKAVDDLLSLMTIEIDRPASYGFLTYKNLILTLWAAYYLKLPARKLKPIHLEKFLPFFKALLPGEAEAGVDKPRNIPQAMKDHFLNWLATDTGLKDFELTERLGQTLENLFEEIESELGSVAAEDLAPRYVQLFLLHS
ncbi:MAG: hypothetical protein JSW26_21595 [Desulfobacterales bacterium]|nr:MAG: hypothetical protein JSW26_21595 [Desulfobacterales bacterium]